MVKKMMKMLTQGNRQSNQYLLFSPLFFFSFGFFFLLNLFIDGSLILLSAKEAPTQVVFFSEQPVQKEITATFIPPKGWSLVDDKRLPPSVKVMVVGKGKQHYPPSINLAVEPYKGTLKEYLKTVQAINRAQGAEWKDLGSVQTEAGLGALSQVEMHTEWGDVRLMHVMFLESGMLYALTVAALKEEFSQSYNDFFSAIRSFKINSQNN